MRQAPARSWITLRCASPVEPLEVRRLLAASVVEGVLYVDGTDAGEEIAVRGTFGESSFDVTVGAEQTAVPSQGVRRIVVRAGAGDDSVLVDLPVLMVAVRKGTRLPVWIDRLTVEGGDGNDAVEADAPNALLLGGAGDDRLTGGRRNDVLRGGAGDDELTGGAGRDNLSGGAGDDSLAGAEGRDRIRGGAGSDRFLLSDKPAERIDFGRGDALSVQPLRLGERARVDNGVLLITGTGGADTIRVRQEVSPAPPGINPIRYTYTIQQGDGVIESGFVTPDDANGIRIDAGGGDDEVDVTEASGPSVGLGVTVLGGSGNDRILGSSGNDLLNGGAGDDHIDGGAGDDRLGSIYLGPSGDDEPQPGEEFPPEPGDDVITGGAGADVVDAGAGTDRVSGGEGHDRLYGGAGADEVRGEGGFDTFYPQDEPAEHLDRAEGEPADEVFDITPPSATFPSARVENGVLIIRGTEAGESIRVGQEVVPGSAPGDPASVVRFFYTGFVGDVGFTESIESGGRITSVLIQAGGGDDVVDLNAQHARAPGREFTGVTLPVTVFGGDGNDRITGGAGDDRLNGGAGDDQIDGGGGDDLVGRSIQAPDVPPGMDAATPQFPEPGNDRLVGGAGNDRVDGGEGDDDIFGGDGDDRVAGGNGADEVRGEGGRDTFSAADDPAEQLDREPNE